MKTKKAPAAFIATGRMNLRWIAAHRDRILKCGAMAKGTGQPCQQFAMANGRCYYHGGRTPKGKDWHRTRWPKKSAPDAIEKMEAKLLRIDRARKARKKRLATMTSDERAAYDKWQSTHAVGTPASRERKRNERKQNAAFRARHGITLPDRKPLTEFVSPVADPALSTSSAVNPDEWDIFQ